MKPNKQPVYTGAGARRSRLLAQDRRADPLSAMSACGRYCCKSRKSQGDEFFAKTRNGKHSPIRMTSIALPKSPVSLT
jgi:hypothetical protein